MYMTSLVLEIGEGCSHFLYYLQMRQAPAKSIHIGTSTSGKLVGLATLASQALSVSQHISLPVSGMWRGRLWLVKLQIGHVSARMFDMALCCLCWVIVPPLWQVQTWDQLPHGSWAHILTTYFNHCIRHTSLYNYFQFHSIYTTPKSWGNLTCMRSVYQTLVLQATAFT